MVINGISYTDAELIKLARKKLNSKKIKEYERSFYSFMLDWSSAIATITVKTSGSTDVPKNIQFRKKQMVESAKMTCKYFNISTKTNALLCLSTAYIGGKMMVVRAFVSGMNLIIVPSSGNPLKGVSERIDFAAMVPLQALKCLNHPATKSIFQSINQVIIGGARIPYSIETALAHCPNHIYSTFGMTETLSHIAVRRITLINPDDTYTLLPGIKIKKDERDCLVIEAPFLAGGKVITNDRVEIIDDSHFKWLGRYDNVINSGGIKIHPELLEKKLSSIITKYRFFISSIPDDVLGNKVVLAIEGASRHEIQKIIDESEKTLSWYEIPKEYISIDKFKETENGKVVRKESLKTEAVFKIIR